MKKPYHNNPRVISDGRLQAIGANIKELGDISGIVVDLNTNEIVGGNQRSKIIDINECEVVYTHKNKKPDAQGTVATGYVVWNGIMLNYREVRWDEKQRQKANITANALTGSFSHKMLSDVALTDLRAWGITPEIIDKIQKENQALQLQDTQPVYPIVPEFSEKYDYVVILAKNEIEINFLDNFFDLRVEQSYKTSKVGIGRVLDFERFKQIIDGNGAGKTGNSKPQKG